ncbi:MAG: hypothetical protein PHW46_06500, partial [Candidatus Omnitrophica bacterium]|nr:hypothetical protein [Candidatus Omnitrophota bacterium]
MARGVTPLPLIDPSHFSIPENLGEVRDIRTADPGKVIIHIQDAHCNYSCQNSITDMIGYLCDTYGIDLVALEGASGGFDLSCFTKIQDKAVRTRVADYFVRSGRVNGAEFYAISNPEKITLKGLEDASRYATSLKAFRGNLEKKKEIDSIFGFIKMNISKLKENIFSSQLKEFDALKTDFRNKKIELENYITSIENLASEINIDITGFLQIQKLSTLLQKERKIDFRKANIERNKLLDR